MRSRNARQRQRQRQRQRHKSTQESALQKSLYMRGIITEEDSFSGISSSVLGSMSDYVKNVDRFTERSASIIASHWFSKLLPVYEDDSLVAPEGWLHFLLYLKQFSSNPRKYGTRGLADRVSSSIQEYSNELASVNWEA